MLPAAGWRVVAAACLLAAADALTVNGRFHLDAGDETHGPEYEITKFTFAVGESMAKGTVRFPATDMNMMTSPALYLFNDEVWEKYHSAPACMDKVQVAHSVIKIGVPTDDGNQHVQRSRHNYGYDKVAKNTKASLRIDGADAVWSFEWKITHTDRSKGWFLIAADCALEQYNAKVAPMTYEVTLLNPGDNHLPADEMWMPTFYAILLAMMVGHIGYCLNLLSASYETHSKVLLIVKLLGVAYVLQFVSLLFEELHLVATVLSGRGVFAIDFLSELLEGMSCLVLSFVLICLACGWTLVEEDADAKKSMSLATMLQNPRNLVAKGAIVGNLMVVAMLGLTVYTMMLVFWNKLGDADFTKFHDSDTASGQVLLKIRLGLFAFFAISLFVTLRKQVCLCVTTG